MDKWIAVEVDGLRLQVHVNDCPRCRGYHMGMIFEPLAQEENGFTHFAMCPQTKERILLRINDRDDDD